MNTFKKQNLKGKEYFTVDEVILLKKWIKIYHK